MKTSKNLLLFCCILSHLVTLDCFDISFHSKVRSTVQEDLAMSKSECPNVDSLLEYGHMRLPKLIAFDLDGTIWTPDMYELWGGGAPFRFATNGKDLVDRAGTTVRLLGVADRILHDLHTHPHLSPTKLAWVSCTDEPSWAAECLEKFKTAGGTKIGQVIHSSQIFKSNKQTHFRNLKQQFPDIGYEEMLFFDNEHYNIENVSRIGVKCYYARSGMTMQAWEEGLKLFQKTS